MSTNMPRERGIFYGWYIVAAGFVSLWFHAGVGFYSFPVFLVALTENLGWGRGATNVGMSLTFLMGGFVSPAVGRLVSKYGVKRIILGGSLIMSAAFFLFSRMQTLWQFYIICVGFAVGVSCTGPMSTSYAVSDWFDKKRGTAMGIMMVGIGVGGLIIVPLTRWLIDRFLWQTTFMIYGILTSLVLIPVAGTIFKRRPAELGVLPDGEMFVGAENPDERNADVSPALVADASGWTFREAVRTSTFWIISAAFVLVTFGQTAILINQVAYFQDIGISPEKAARALGLCAFLGIAGKLFFGTMADRYPTRYAMALCFGLQAVGTVVLLCTPMLGSPMWFVIVWGFPMGGVVTLEPLIVSECFGIKSFGSILGTMYVLTTMGASIGPPFAGFIFDINKSYFLAFALFVLTTSLATALSLLAVPQRPLQR
ncbi:MAG: MFS transporter [Candidatus Hydrogenedentota bacterium]|nr:MAG: MFS transporter [Candidatus Hydrogenedentota bacterium]